MPLDLNAFRAIAGSDVSTGYVGLNETTNKTTNEKTQTLTKVAAHRYKTGKNKNEETALEDLKTNREIRMALYDAVGKSFGSSSDARMQAFMNSVAKKLGIKVGAGGKLKSVSDKKLERRDVRVILGSLDRFSKMRAPDNTEKDSVVLEMPGSGGRTWRVGATKEMIRRFLPNVKTTTKEQLNSVRAKLSERVEKGRDVYARIIGSGGYQRTTADNYAQDAADLALYFQFVARLSAQPVTGRPIVIADKGGRLAAFFEGVPKVAVDQKNTMLLGGGQYRVGREANDHTRFGSSDRLLLYPDKASQSWHGRIPAAVTAAYRKLLERPGYSSLLRRGVTIDRSGDPKGAIRDLANNIDREIERLQQVGTRTDKKGDTPELARLRAVKGYLVEYFPKETLLNRVADETIIDPNDLVAPQGGGHVAPAEKQQPAGEAPRAEKDSKDWLAELDMYGKLNLLSAKDQAFVYFTFMSEVDKISPWFDHDVLKGPSREINEEYNLDCQNVKVGEDQATVANDAAKKAIEKLKALLNGIDGAKFGRMKEFRESLIESKSYENADPSIRDAFAKALTNGLLDDVKNVDRQVCAKNLLSFISLDKDDGLGCKGEGKYDFARAKAILQDCGIDLKTFLGDKRTAFFMMLEANNKSTFGLDEFARRVSGHRLAELTLKQAEHYNELSKQQGGTFLQRQLGDNVSKLVDPITNVKGVSKTNHQVLIGLVKPSATGIPPQDVCGLLDALRRLTVKGEGTDTVNLNGKKVPIELRKGGAVIVTIDKLPVRVPVTAEQMVADLEDDLANNTRHYGDERVLSRLPSLTEEDALGGSDSRHQELYARVVCSRLGLSADEVAGVDVFRLRQLAREALMGRFCKADDSVDTDCVRAYLEQISSKSEISSASSLEARQRLLKARKEFVEATIRLPQKAEDFDANLKRLDFSSTEAALHELLADLLVNRDFAAFDLKKRDLKNKDTEARPGERIYTVLKANVSTLANVLADMSSVYSLPKEMRDGVVEALRTVVEALGTDFFGKGKNLVFDDLLYVGQLKAMEDLKMKIGALPEGDMRREHLDKLLEEVTDDMETLEQSNPGPETLKKLTVKSNPLSTLRMVQLGGTISAALFTLGLEKGPSSQEASEAYKGFWKRLGEAEAEIDEGVEEVMGNLQDLIVSQFNEVMEDAGAEAVPGKKDQKEVWSQTFSELLGKGAFDPNVGFGAFLCGAIRTYFNSSDPVDKRTMLSSLIRYSGARSTFGEQLGALLKGAGPLLQKMLQKLPIESFTADIQLAIKDMKSRLAPIPPEFVKAQLLELQNRSGGKIKSIDVLRSIGAASVGQAFLCKIVTTDHPEGEECVVKLLRPDAKKRIQREKKILLECADEVAGMRATFEGQLERILDELDFTVEGRFAQLGRQTYHCQLGYTNVRSVEIHPDIPPTADAFVMKRAPGVTADEWFETVRKELKEMSERGPAQGVTELATRRRRLSRLFADTLKRQQSIVALSKLWTHQGVYGNGFYHGDLHAGNVMVDDSGCTVIDFGNAVQLTPDQQKQINRMIMGAFTSDSVLYIDSFRALLDDAGRAEFDQHNMKGELTKVLRDILAKGDVKSVAHRIFASLTFLQNSGVRVPGPIYNFSQCQMCLMSTVEQMNGLLGEITEALGATTLRDGNFGPRVEAQTDLEAAKDSIELVGVLLKAIRDDPTGLRCFEDGNVNIIDTLKDHPNLKKEVILKDILGRLDTDDHWNAFVSSDTFKVLTTAAPTEGSASDVSLRDVPEKLEQIKQAFDEVREQYHNLSGCENRPFDAVSTAARSCLTLPQLRVLSRILQHPELCKTLQGLDSVKDADTVISDKGFDDLFADMTDDQRSKCVEGLFTTLTSLAKRSFTGVYPLGEKAPKTLKEMFDGKDSFLAEMVNEHVKLYVELGGKQEDVLSKKDGDAGKLIEDLGDVVETCCKKRLYINMQVGELSKRLWGVLDNLFPSGKIMGDAKYDYEAMKGLEPDTFVEAVGEMLLSQTAKIVKRVGYAKAVSIKTATEQIEKSNKRWEIYQSHLKANLKVLAEEFKNEIKPEEFELIREEAEGFCFPADSEKLLKEGGWTKNDQTLEKVINIVRTNVKNLLDRLRALGVETTGDAARAKAILRYAAEVIGTKFPGLFLGVQKMSDKEYNDNLILQFSSTDGDVADVFDHLREGMKLSAWQMTLQKVDEVAADGKKTGNWHYENVDSLKPGAPAGGKPTGKIQPLPDGSNAEAFLKQKDGQVNHP